MKRAVWAVTYIWYWIESVRLNFTSHHHYACYYANLATRKRLSK